MPAHRTQNTRRLRVEATPMGAPPINIISPTPQTFIFADTNTINTDAASYPFTAHPQASHSLPNLFAFHASEDPYAFSLSTDAQSQSPSDTGSLYTVYTSSPTSSFASPPNSLYGSSYASSPPESAGTPPLSLSPSPPPPADEHHQLTSSSASSGSPAPYPHPLPPHSNGQARLQPPRPPNPWICFRNVRSQQYKESGEFPRVATNTPDEARGRGRGRSASVGGAVERDDESPARRPRQADLSKHISLEWKALTDDEKAPYVRMSEEAKIVHARIYPGYKYQPRRRVDGSLKAESKKPGEKKKPVRKPVKKAGKKRDFDSEIAVDEPQLPVPIRLPSLNVDVNAHGQECAGDDDSKAWTHLPEQTLLPFAWDLEQGHDDVMAALDANVDEGSESNEIEFGKPFYPSFPPLAPASDSDLAPFFPFPAEADSDSGSDPSSFSGFANYDFQSSALGLQDVHVHTEEPDSELSQSTAHILDFGMGDNREVLPESQNPYLGMSELAEFSFGDTPAPPQDNSDQAQASSSSSQAGPSALPNFRPLPSWNKLTAPPRRGSLPTPGPSHATSPDGFLRPPYISQARSRTRARASSDMGGVSSYVRAIPTANYNTSTGITTSVLIPTMSPQYDVELESDLAAYSRAIGTTLPASLTPAAKSPSQAQASSSSASSSSRANRQNLEDGDLDLNVEFDFEAEFGDIIDMHGRGARRGSV